MYTEIQKTFINLLLRYHLILGIRIDEIDDLVSLYSQYDIRNQKFLLNDLINSIIKYFSGLRYI